MDFGGPSMWPRSFRLSYLQGKTVLEQALKAKAQYVGKIGSHRKRDRVFSDVEMHGFTTDDFKRAGYWIFPMSFFHPEQRLST